MGAIFVTRCASFACLVLAFALFFSSVATDASKAEAVNAQSGKNPIFSDGIENFQQLSYDSTFIVSLKNPEEGALVLSGGVADGELATGFTANGSGLHQCRIHRNGELPGLDGVPNCQ